MQHFIKAYLGAGVAVTVIFNHGNEVEILVGGVAVHTFVDFPAAAAKGGAGGAQQAGIVLAQNAYAACAFLHGVVVKHGAGKLAHALFQFIQTAMHPADLIGAEVAAHAANHVDRKNNAVARRGFADVHDMLADTPELLEHAFKAKRVGKQAEPQHMGVYPVQF